VKKAGGNAGFFVGGKLINSTPSTQYRTSPDRSPRLLEPAGAVNRPTQGRGNRGRSGREAFHEVAVPITLQSTVSGFSAEFMRKLPGVEQAMIAHGLEPSQFVISKDRATPPTVPFIGPFFYDYTVFVGDESFTVTEPNDIKFLDYFYQRCIAEDEVAAEQVQRTRRPGLISRIFRWMAQPI
jgi:hypothetical protein